MNKNTKTKNLKSEKTAGRRAKAPAARRAAKATTTRRAPKTEKKAAKSKPKKKVVKNIQVRVSPSYYARVVKKSQAGKHKTIAHFVRSLIKTAVR